MTLLVAALHPMPDYLNPATAPTFFISPSYRVVAFRSATPAHELGADAGFLFLPGAGGLGYCVGEQVGVR